MTPMEEAFAILEEACEKLRIMGTIGEGVIEDIKDAVTRIENETNTLMWAITELENADE